MIKSDALRKIHSFMFLKPLYVKPLIRADTDLEDIGSEFTIWLAYIRERQPPIIIYDADSFVSRNKLQLSLTPLTKDEEEDLLASLPEGIMDKIMKIIEEYGKGEHSIFFKPVPTLRDASALREINWIKDVIEPIINYGNAVKDQNVLLVRKCTLLRGLKMNVNPHFIEVLPPNTGKTEFADAVGIHEDKASAASLIGTADMDGIKPGSLHGAELPVSFDQIEESSYKQLFRYLLSFMELGRARVDNAAQPFEISGSPIIGIYANPFGDPKNDFFFLLHKLSQNPALGRRFGLFLYDYDTQDHTVPRVTKKERDLRTAIAEPLGIFRAVEEYAKKDLQKFINNEHVWAWLTEKNEAWIEQALKVLEPLRTSGVTTYDPTKLVEFFENFIRDGNTHTRGGALYGAIVENLDKIALNEVSTEYLLKRAEEILAEILDMNFRSIQKVVQNFSESKESLAARVFDSLPKYLKEIVSACEHFRSTLAPDTSLPFTVKLSSIRYKPKTKDRWGQVLDDLRGSNVTKHNAKLKDVFGIEVTIDGDVTFYRLEITPGIEPWGFLSEPSEKSELSEHVGGRDTDGKLSSIQDAHLGLTVLTDKKITEKESKESDSNTDDNISHLGLSRQITPTSPITPTTPTQSSYEHNERDEDSACTSNTSSVSSTFLLSDIKNKENPGPPGPPGPQQDGPCELCGKYGQLTRSKDGYMVCSVCLKESYAQQSVTKEDRSDSAKPLSLPQPEPLCPPWMTTDEWSKLSLDEKLRMLKGEDKE